MVDNGRKDHYSPLLNTQATSNQSNLFLIKFMKKLLLLFLPLLAMGYSYAQNTFPGSGNVGIGTINPNATLEVKGATSYDGASILRITNNSGDFGRTNLILTGRIEQGNDSWNFENSGRNSIVFAQNEASSQQNIGVIGDEKMSLQLEGNSNSLGFLSASRGNSSNTVITQSGFIGINTTSPQSRFHINDAGTSSNGNQQYNGNLIIRGNSGSRSSTVGPSLEFAIPPNTDGNNV